LVRRRLGRKRLWRGRRIILPPFVCMLTTGSTRFGSRTSFEFLLNRLGLDWVLDDDKVMFGKYRTADF
jgi:hypothetical protein